MWICLNNAFLSIVNHPTDKKQLLVRARRKGDLERLFGDVNPVERTPHRDYLFRMSVPRKVVAEIIAEQVLSVDYPNFKASVRDKKLHDAYTRVWSIMSGLQPTPPYSGAGRRRGGGRSFFSASLF